MTTAVMVPYTFIAQMNLNDPHSVVLKTKLENRYVNLARQKSGKLSKIIPVNSNLICWKSLKKLLEFQICGAA